MYLLQIWQIFTDSSLEEVFGEARMVGVLKAEGYIEFNKEYVNNYMVEHPNSKDCNGMNIDITWGCLLSKF